MDVGGHEGQQQSEGIPERSAGMRQLEIVVVGGNQEPHGRQEAEEAEP